eukprot:gene11941-13177_t
MAGLIPSINIAVLSLVRRDLILARNFHGTGLLLKKKSEWRLHRRPCNTKLRPDQDEWIQERKAYGGRKKSINDLKLPFLPGLELEVPILDVVHSDTNKNHIMKKIMTKGSIIQIDGTEFSNRLLEATAESREESSNELAINSEAESEQKSASRIDDNLQTLMKNRKLFAKITTRPGQDGLCNGYVLEGPELEVIMNKLLIKDGTTVLK